MRVVKLSDHPGEMLREARGERAAGAARDRQRQEQAAARHRAAAAKAARARDKARSQRRWLAWLGGIITVWRLQRQGPAAVAAPRPAVESHREAQLAAGARGEQLAQDWLGRLLGDEWTLLRGYRNRRGEIDHVLVGPGGVAAIECKHRNATVACSGDRWAYVKYDNYGNAVERGELADRRGRSPSEQLNQPADELERFLRSRGHRVPIRRVVLLTHERSAVGRCTDPTVHIMTSAQEILALLRRSRSVIPAEECDALQRLIVRDHQFHARPRPAAR